MEIETLDFAQISQWTLEIRLTGPAVPMSITICCTVCTMCAVAFDCSIQNTIHNIYVIYIYGAYRSSMAPIWRLRTVSPLAQGAPTGPAWPVGHHTAPRGSPRTTAAAAEGAACGPSAARCTTRARRAAWGRGSHLAAQGCVPVGTGCTHWPSLACGSPPCTQRLPTYHGDGCIKIVVVRSHSSPAVSDTHALTHTAS